MPERKKQARPGRSCERPHTSSTEPAVAYTDFSNLRRRRLGGRPAAFLLAVLCGLVLHGHALGQPRAIWNDQLPVWKVAFSPDGKTLASFSSSAEAAVKLWDVASGKVMASLPTDLRGGCSLLLFTPDGKGLVASAGRRQHDEEAKLGLGAGRAILWDVKTRKVQSTIDFPSGTGGFALTPDGKTLIAGAWEKGAVQYDLATGKEVGTIDCAKEAKGGGVSLALSQDGKMLAVGLASGAVLLWDLEKKEAIRTIQADGGCIDVLRFSPDGKTIATAANAVAHGKAELWDVATGKHTDTLDVRFRINKIREIAFAPDGKSVAIVGGGLCPALWDFGAGGERDDFGGPEVGPRLSGAAFSSDGKTLATCSDNKTIQLWDVPLGKPTRIKPRE